MLDHEELWNRARLQLEETVDRDSWERYLSGITAVAYNTDKQVLTLGTQNDFVALWLESNYRDLIEEKLAVVRGEPLTTEFVGGYDPPKEAVAPPKTAVSAPPGGGARQRFLSTEHPHMASSTVRRQRLRLRPDFTFGTFVVGDNTKLCVAAAHAVSQQPGQHYNPFFVYGNSGLGKTHLLQAVANDLAAGTQNARIEYLTSEEFVNQYVEAVQKSTLPAFRRRFRSVDLLLVDDVQFFSGKIQSSEELFHTFNSLYNDHRQIVLAADRTPTELGLDDRMISRFNGGLAAELMPPEFETRLAILRKKQELQKVKLGDDVLCLIAERIRSNIRHLEGALTILTMNVSALGCRMTSEMAEQLLKDKFEDDTPRAVTIDEIQKEVASAYDVTVADLLSRKRPQNIARARMSAMYLARQLTDFSLPVIGNAFNRNHATVLHAVDSLEKRMSAEPAVRARMDNLTRKLTS